MDRLEPTQGSDLPASFGGYDLLYRGAQKQYGVKPKWSFSGTCN